MHTIVIFFNKKYIRYKYTIQSISYKHDLQLCQGADFKNNQTTKQVNNFYLNQ